MKGHRDHGDFPVTKPDYNDDKLLASLRFWADAGDVSVSNNLAYASRNARYLHHSIQNEIMNICNQQILNEILRRQRKSTFFYPC